MYDLLRCDSCSRPLGEGALARNEAIERGGLKICARCLVLEAQGTSLPVSPTPTSLALWKPQRPHLEPSPALPEETASEPLPTVPIEVDPSPPEPLHPAQPKLEAPARPQPKFPKLPKARRLSGPPAVGASPFATQTASARKSSPLLGPAILLLVVVLPIFIWSLSAHSRRIQQQEEAAGRISNGNEAHNELQERLRKQEEELARLQRRLRPDKPDEEPEAGAKPSSNTPPARPLAEPLLLQPDTLALLDELEASAAKPVIEGLASTSRAQRLLALSHAIRHQAYSARSFLRHHLSTAPELDERELAALALGEIGDRDAIELLKSIEGDPTQSATLRRSCRLALNLLDGRLRDPTLSLRSSPELETLLSRLSTLPEAAAVADLLRGELEERDGGR